MSRPFSVLLAAAALAALPREAGGAASKRAAARLDAEGDADPKQMSPKNAERLDKVVDTLNDILVGLENSQKEEASVYQQFNQWCTSTLSTSKESRDQNQLQYDQSSVDEKEQLASEEHLKASLADIKKERSDLQDMLAQATSMREDEVDKYTEEMQMNKESISQVGQAIKIVQSVQSQGGFLQNGVLKRLQVNEPGESSYVLGIMKQLREKLGKSRDEMEAAEQTRKSKHDQMALTKRQQIESLTQQLAVKQQKVAETGVGLVQTRRLISQAEKQVTDLDTVLQDTKEKCEQKQKEWKTRSEDRTKEIASLRLAIDYLQESKKKGAATSAVQIPSFLQTRSQDSGESSMAPVIGAFLSTADADLAAMGTDISEKNKKEMLDGAKSAVTSLIKVLDEEQKDEKNMQDHCKTTLQSKDDEKASVEEEISLLTATIARKAAEIETLTSQVTQVEAEISAAKASLESAAGIRKKEKKLYETAKRDRALAVKVLKQARAVLTQFYETQDPTSLAQEDAGADQPATPQHSSRKTVLGMQAVQMMEKIIGEVEQEQKDADIEENDAAASFEQLKVDSVKEFDDSMATITDRVKRRATLGVQLGTDKETLTQRQEDLDAVNQQLQALHGRCDELIANYEKRTKARSFEISQLRDVFDILSGSSVASRTGFLEKARQSVSDIEAKARQVARQ